jgi:hypothetical protein
MINRTVPSRNVQVVTDSRLSAGRRIPKNAYKSTDTATAIASDQMYTGMNIGTKTPKGTGFLGSTACRKTTMNTAPTIRAAAAPIKPSQDMPDILDMGIHVVEFSTIPNYAFSEAECTVDKDHFSREARDNMLS